MVGLRDLNPRSPGPKQLTELFSNIFRSFLAPFIPEKLLFKTLVSTVSMCSKPGYGQICGQNRFPYAGCTPTYGKIFYGDRIAERSHDCSSDKQGSQDRISVKICASIIKEKHLNLGHCYRLCYIYVSTTKMLSFFSMIRAISSSSIKRTFFPPSFARKRRVPFNELSKYCGAITAISSARLSFKPCSTN